MAWIDDYRKVNPWADKYSDADIVNFEAGQAGVDPQRFAQSIGIAQHSGNAGDFVTDVKRGIQKIPGAVTGMLDIPVALVTGRPMVSEGWDNIADITGFKPGKWSEDATLQYSPGRQQARREIDQAWENGSAGDIAGAYLTNPAATFGTILESAPSMVGGGVLGRGLANVGRGAALRGGAAGPVQPGYLTRVAGERAPYLAAAGGEGAFAAGSAMDQLTDAGVDPRKAALAAAGTGVGTGALGYVGGRMANRLGLGDLETTMVGGIEHAPGTVPSLGRRVAGGAVSEGLLEEAPQSAQEQMWQNWAQGKDLMEGVGRNTLEGALAGGVMGSGINMRPAPKTPVLPAAETDLLGGNPYPNYELVTNPDPLQERINANLGIGRGLSVPRGEVKDAFNAPIDPTVVNDANGNPYTTTKAGDLYDFQNRLNLADREQAALAAERQRSMAGAQDLLGDPLAYPIPQVQEQAPEAPVVNKRQQQFDFNPPNRPEVLYGNQFNPASQPGAASTQAGAFTQLPITDQIRQAPGAQQQTETQLAGVKTVAGLKSAADNALAQNLITPDQHVGFFNEIDTNRKLNLKQKKALLVSTIQGNQNGNQENVARGQEGNGQAGQPQGAVPSREVGIAQGAQERGRVQEGRNGQGAQGLLNGIETTQAVQAETQGPQASVAVPASAAVNVAQSQQVAAEAPQAAAEEVAPVTRRAARSVARDVEALGANTKKVELKRQASRLYNDLMVEGNDAQIDEAEAFLAAHVKKPTRQGAKDFRNASPRDKAIIFDRLGWDEEGNAVGEPMTNEAVAEKHGLTAARVNQILVDHGITDQVVDRAVATDAGVSDETTQELANTGQVTAINSAGGSQSATGTGKVSKRTGKPPKAEVEQMSDDDLQETLIAASTADPKSKLNDHWAYKELTKRFKQREQQDEISEDNETTQELDGDLSDWDARFSKGNETQNPTTIEKVAQELKGLFFTKTRFDNKVTVVNSIEELPADVRQSAAPDGNTQAFVMPNGKAYMIAGNIEQGQELAVFLHEVGVHLGMPGLLGEENFVKLAKQIGTWSQAKGDSIEIRVARLAYARVNSAANTAQAEGRPFEDGDIAHELIAYFVEEAVAAGINPTAAAKAGGPIYNWFRTMWAAVKTALRKFGLDRIDSLTTQNIVDLAYGAAALELEGTWHGTAADFRRFDHDYMGTGEGAQAFGWGTYLAQRPGIAKEYWKDDVLRKSKPTQNPIAWSVTTPGNDITVYEGTDNFGNDVGIVEFNGEWSVTRNVGVVGKFGSLAEAKKYAEYSGQSKPEGSLMRTSVAATEDEMLDWDNKQRPAILEKIGMYMHTPLQEALAEELNLDIDQMNGEDIYNGLKALEIRNGDVADYMDADTVNKIYSRNKNDKVGAMEVVSTYLDQMGIKGIQFLDALSRNKDTALVDKNGKTPTLFDANARNTLVFSNGFASLDEAISDAKNQAERYPSMQDIVDTLTKWKNAGYKLVEANQTRNLVVFNDKNIIRAVTYQGADRNKVRFSSKADASTPTGFFSKLGGTLDDLLANPKGFIKQHGLGWMTLEQIADTMKSEAVKAYVGVMNKMQQMSKERVYDAAKIDVDWAKLSPNVQERLSEVMREATRAGFDPAVATERATTYEQQELRRKFNGLPTEAKNIYTKVRDYYADNFEQRKAIMMDAANQARRDGKNMAEVERMFSQVKGPYFPLMRLGSWYSVGMSDTLADLQAKVEDKTATEQEIERYNQLRQDPNHYSTSGHMSRREAKRAADELRQRFGNAHFNLAETRINKEMSKIPDLAVLEQYMATDLPGSTRTEIKDMLAQMYFDLMPENSALKRLMKREGVHGEEKDMRRVFAASAISQAHHISRMKYANDLSEAMVNVRKEGRRDEMKRMIANELDKRTELAMQKDDNPVVDRLLQGSYFAHLGLSPAFLLTNMTQVPMITAPWLGARYGFGKASSALASATADAIKIIKGTYENGDWRSEFDWNTVYPKGSPEDRLLQALLDRNILDITIEHDLGSVVNMSNSKLDDAIKVANLPVRVTETANRLVTGLSAYRLAVEKGMPHDDAVDHAAKAISETQLNYSGLNAPRHMQSVLGSKAIAKLMFQFRKYQQGMVYLIVKNAKEALSKVDSQERAEARKTLFGLMATTGLMAGATGMPFAGSVFWLASMIGGIGGDDDEPFNAEVEFRNFMADTFGDEIALALSKGLPTLFNVDLSNNVGMGNIGMPLPYIRNGNKPSETMQNALAASAGAAFGTVADTLDGMALLMDGDFGKGAEKIIPVKMAKNLIKAYGMADEGMLNSRGELILPSESFSPWDIALRAAGFTTATESEYYDANAAMQEAKQAATDTRNKLLREYANARMSGEDVSDFQEQIADFNTRHPEKGVRIDQSSLLKAVQARQNLSKNRTETGLRQDKYMKPYLKQGSFADGQ